MDDIDGGDIDDGRTGSLKRKRLSGKPGVKWQPGGSPDDYFFDEVPNWTVSNALNRLLTKVRNNPNRTITIQKFIKDSCKGNLKTYFETVRDGMGKGDSVVMAEVAYKSFIQLTVGPNPLLRIFPPKSKPRTRAAAVSEEGYAYKDYIVQVTEHGFDFMRVKPVYDDAGSPPRKARKITHDQLGLMSPTDMGIPGSSSHSKFGPNMALIPLISEQEQEIATNMLLYFKASIDGLLATIVHLRSENQNLQKENMTLAMLNGTLNSDYEAHKTQLIKITQFIQQQQQHQDLQSGMMQQSQQGLLDQQQSILLQEQQQQQLMQQQQQGLQLHDQYQHHDQLQQHLQQLQQQQLQAQQLQQQQLLQQQQQQQQLQQQEFAPYSYQNS